MAYTRNTAFFIVAMLVCCIAAAQHSSNNADGNSKGKKPNFLNNIFQDAVNSIIRNPDDTLNNNAMLIAKSEQAFSRYEGKIIRSINIRHFGFERTFLDTSTRIGYVGTRILNKLHTDTKPWIIRQNLFISEGEMVNASKLADNERYLRTLEFIQDARIFITPVRGSNDSVDINVITKDLFSLTGIVDVGGTQSFKARIAEVNLLGMAQRVQLTGLWEQNRYPRTGYEVLYSKTNIGGSFVNSTIAYTNINTGRSEGLEDENAFYLRLERPLVSPFSHFAGAMEVSFNQSINVYSKPETEFLNYHYNVYDAWIGYNLGTKKLLEENNYEENRNRVFVSGRYVQTDYLTTPAVVGNNFDPIYNSRKMLLGQVSFFRQDFYKLNYIYGFGTTEDVPIGYNVSVTGGWTRHLTLERPYAGFQAEQYIITPRGGFIDAVVKAGGYYRNGKMEDASTLVSVNFFTRLFSIQKFKTREYFKISFTQLRNRMIYQPLMINNTYGLDEFSTDSVKGTRRISLYGESVLYTNKKLIGFRFAPFVAAGLTVVTPEDLPFKRSDGYTAFGGGVRTRNENLVFGTIELRALYYPRPVFPVTNFRVLLRSELRFRYKTNFVQAPDVVQLNTNER